jgi:hypothetical protein
MTLSITTFSIMTLSIKGLFVTLSITMLCVMLSVNMLGVAFFDCYPEFYYAECSYAECRYDEYCGAVCLLQVLF